MSLGRCSSANRDGDLRKPRKRKQYRDWLRLFMCPLLTLATPQVVRAQDASIPHQFVPQIPQITIESVQYTDCHAPNAWITATAQWNCDGYDKCDFQLPVAAAKDRPQACPGDLAILFKCSDDTQTWSLRVPGDATPGFRTSLDCAALGPKRRHLFLFPGPAPALPITMSECEGIPRRCGAWLFDGRRAEGNWEWLHGDGGTWTWFSGGRWYNAAGHLSVVQYDAYGVTLTRTDTDGPTAGLTAVYRGVVDKQKIAGDVTFTWPGHLDQAVEPWSASFLEGVTAADAYQRSVNSMALPDKVQAKRWLFEAARKDDSRAQRMLAANLLPAPPAQTPPPPSPEEKAGPSADLKVILGLALGIGVLGWLASRTPEEQSDAGTDSGRSDDHEAEMEAYQRRRAEQAEREQEANQNRSDPNDGLGCTWGYRQGLRMKPCIGLP